MASSHPAPKPTPHDPAGPDRALSPRKRSERAAGRAVRLEHGVLVLDLASPAPALKPGEALIRPTRLSTSSTDVAVLEGRLEFRGIMGHEFVGIVERLEPIPTPPPTPPLTPTSNSTPVPRDADARWLGKRVVGSPIVVCGKCDLCRGGLGVHCRDRTVMGLDTRGGCFADHFTLPTVNLFEVPKNVDDEHALFAPALSVAFQAASLIRLEGKTYVTILGDGPLGLLAAQIMARRNARTRLLGRVPEKFSLCERWGVKHRHIDDVGRREDQDVVFDCTGSPEGLETAMRLVRPRGKIVTVGAPVAMAPRPSAHSSGPRALSPIIENEIELVGSRCGRMTDALTLLAKGEVDVTPMISARYRLEQAELALRHAARPETVKVLIEP